jgi:putative DNA primase/helicase
MVITTETEEGRAWAEARIKALTGGDPITARFMRRDFFTFTPEFKLTISGNHKPSLRNVDDAARRRFNIVPFLRRPARPDKALFERLRPEWPGILRWLINGCLAWQQSGLNPPLIVQEATNEYFEEQDVLGQWLDECCEVNRGVVDTSASLFSSWRNYAQGRGEEVHSAKWFKGALERHSDAFRAIKDAQGIRGRGFRGVRVRVFSEGGVGG